MQQSRVWLATALLHHRVRNRAGEDLGKIEDFAVDPVNGSLQYAILSFGGVLGLGDKRFPVPWSSLSLSPARDYWLLDIDKERLRQAPGFARDTLPNMSDPVWQRSIHDYYGTGVASERATVVERPTVVGRPTVIERPTVVERHVVERPVVQTKQGMSLLGGILIVCLVLGLAWMTFLVSTRGWDQAQQDIKSSLQGAVYAAKETSHDAAITTKVKTALSLSKRIPGGLINVDSEGDVVTLRGEVQSDQVRELAESIARDVPGVSEVHNHLFAVQKSQ